MVRLIMVPAISKVSDMLSNIILPRILEKPEVDVGGGCLRRRTAARMTSARAPRNMNASNMLPRLTLSNRPEDSLANVVMCMMGI